MHLIFLLSHLILFGRGTYPGDDSTYTQIASSGFTTVVLSSFYIRANGDVYSGDSRSSGWSFPVGSSPTGWS